MPPDSVYVGRPSAWGNPFRGPDAVSRYRRWVEWKGLEMLPFTAPLVGKTLVCWCPLDQPCHADVLLELANGGPA